MKSVGIGGYGPPTVEPRFSKGLEDGPLIWIMLAVGLTGRKRLRGCLPPHHWVIGNTRKRFLWNY